jgi:hypothetical protein
MSCADGTAGTIHPQGEKRDRPGSIRANSKHHQDISRSRQHKKRLREQAEDVRHTISVDYWAWLRV